MTRGKQVGAEMYQELMAKYKAEVARRKDAEKILYLVRNNHHYNAYDACHDYFDKYPDNLIFGHLGDAK